MKNSFLGNHLDFIGFSASVVCAIHCVAIPALITVLPFIGLGFLLNHWIEYTVMLLSLLLAVFALSHGFRNHHHNWLPLLFVIIGFGTILIGIFFGHGAIEHSILPTGPIQLVNQNKHALPMEHFITPVGALVVSAGHYMNWHCIQKSKNGHTAVEN
ncbi:hypothetical protein GCM10028791_27050 [Echinicola sediminis]